MANTDSLPINALAAADLSAIRWRFGKQTSTGINVCSVAGERADGVIGPNKADALGKALDFYINRSYKVEAGGAFNAGVELTTDAAGKAIAAVAGQMVNAIAAEAGVNGRIVGVLPPTARGIVGALTIADAQLNPGTPSIFTFDIPDAATADYDKVITEKVEVFDVIVHKSVAGAGNTAQLKNAANVITDAIAAAVDKAVTRAGTIDRAFNVINAAGTMRLTVTRAAGSSLMRVFVHCIKRA